MIADAMIYVWASVLTVANLGFLFLIILGLPGAWLMIATAGLLEWLLGPDTQLMAWPVLLVAGILALIGEILEFFAGVAGSKKFGGTKRGAIGAFIGAIIGGICITFVIPVPVIGSLIGACLGAAVGSWVFEVHEGREMNDALKSGVGAGLGRFAGTVLKIGVGVAVWLVITVASYWP